MTSNQICHTKLREQHLEFQVMMKERANREAIRDRWPVCECKVSYTTGSFELCNEVCRLRELSIQTRRSGPRKRDARY